MFTILKSLTLLLASRFPQTTATTVLANVLAALEGGTTGEALKQIISRQAATLKSPASAAALEKGLHGWVDSCEMYHAVKLAALTAPGECWMN